MLESTWRMVFKAVMYIGALMICFYYFMPDMFVLQNVEGKPSLLRFFLITYLVLCLILYIIYYFFNKKTHATTEGLWSIVPMSNGPGKVLLEGKVKSVSGKSELLNEQDTMNFLSESFTFSFFVSVDNASIENIKGENLKNGGIAYQQLIVVPGAFNIEIDPLHEAMKIAFKTYKTKDYDVMIPTLKSRRWHQILISIEGRTADLYQNGILLKSVALPNVISARPGKPYLWMNSDMFARVAFVQSFNKRLLESEVIDNYRVNSDPQGIPRFPTPSETNVFRIPNFNFCLGIYCIGSEKPKGDALTHVKYEYS
jgi:hypothetical protein